MKKLNLSITTLFVISILAISNTWANTGASYSVINPKDDDILDSLDNPHMFKIFKNVENEKNFINKQLALSYIRADKITPKPLNSKYAKLDKMYKIFIVYKKDKVVDVAPYTLELKPKATFKNVTIKTLDNNTGVVCINPKYGAWFNDRSILYNTDGDGNMSTIGNKNQCVFYDKRVYPSYKKIGEQMSGWEWYDDDYPPSFSEDNVVPYR